MESIGGIFDSHAHYDDSRFDGDRDEVLKALPGAGIRLVMNAASNPENCHSTIRLAESYPFVYAAAGVHPHHAGEISGTGFLGEIERHCAHPKVMAVGEIGLDYHYDFAPRAAQCEMFERQLELAARLGLPVIIHSREAAADTLRILRKFDVSGVLHCFTGSAETAREYLAMGFFIGFTGSVTFANAHKLRETAAHVPPERLLIETDCPYLAPVPFRGKRCDSRMLPSVVGTLAKLHRLDPQQIADQTRQNACELFGIRE